MAFKPTPEMEEALAKVLSTYSDENADKEAFLNSLADFENDNMPDEIRAAYLGAVPSDDLLDWEKWVYKDTPWKDEFNGEPHDPDNGAEDSDNSEESEDKPHEEDILPDGEESELEKKMTPEEFKIASNITGRSTGDFEPETPEDIQFMLEANKNGLKVSDERLKNVQSNSINSIANTLKNYRW